MNSLWNETESIPGRNHLPGDKQVDVAVIGGGMAGILTAYYLQKRGRQVIVLEADRVGSGQTHKTTAKITSQHGMIYGRLTKTVGERLAKQYADANQTAVREYRNLVDSLSIDCDFREAPAYLYSVNVSEPLRREADSAARLGIPARFVTKTELPFAVNGAVRFDGQASFHPIKFLKEAASGLTVYEHTKVLRVEGGRVVTNRGCVTARKVVFACHYPFVNFPGFYFARTYQERSYVVALKHAQKLEGEYLGVDPKGFSFRSAGDLLLLGGNGHRTGKQQKSDPYKKLMAAARHFWPRCEAECRWSAQDCMTLDRIPYIGRFSKLRPDWYVATGFQKWGMTSSMVSALLLTDLITGRKNPWREVFSPQRFHAAASFQRGTSHFAKSVRGLILGAVPGSPRCTHMGCRLVWNSADSSWDCPCHGSRFGKNGELLDNPAQEDIAFIN